jgi:hypothetical protein
MRRSFTVIAAFVVAETAHPTLPSGRLPFPHEDSLQP